MNPSFDYKEFDEEGAATLETIANATRFNAWMYQTIRPYCKGRILEIGSGIGNISQFFIRDDANIVLSDIRDQYCAYLGKNYSSQEVVQMDLVHPNFDQEYASLIDSFDTVFALNVVEHIEDDTLAMTNVKKLLRKEGNCVILVPAFQFLYNSFDKELYHFRRYTRSSLNTLMRPIFSIKYETYFNAIGTLGWFVNANLLKKKLIPSDQMKMFDRLVPVFRAVDFFTKRLLGLSVIIVGQKEN